MRNDDREMMVDRFLFNTLKIEPVMRATDMSKLRRGVDVDRAALACTINELKADLYL